MKIERLFVFNLKLSVLNGETGKILGKLSSELSAFQPYLIRVGLETLSEVTTNLLFTIEAVAG